MGDGDRDRSVDESVAVACEQVAEAASDPTRLRSVLSYWFGVMYDEGTQRRRGRGLRDSVTRLQAMNRRLEERLRESGLPPPSDPPED